MPRGITVLPVDKPPFIPYNKERFGAGLPIKRYREKYRSGHNGLDSKSSKPLTGPVGSNPTFSATSPQATKRLRRFFYKSHRRAHSAASPFPKKVTLRLCCTLAPSQRSGLLPTFFGDARVRIHSPKTQNIFFVALTQCLKKSIALQRSTSFVFCGKM